MHEKTEPAMMAAHVSKSWDVDPQKPTLRGKLKTNKMTQRKARGTPAVAAQFPHVPERDCSKHFVMYRSAVAQPTPGRSACSSSSTWCCHAVISADRHSRKGGAGPSSIDPGAGHTRSSPQCLGHRCKSVCRCVHLRVGLCPPSAPLHGREIAEPARGSQLPCLLVESVAPDRERGAAPLHEPSTFWAWS